MKKELDMLIFDLDGTLWETTDTTYETIKEVVKEYNIPYEITRETVTKTMGCTYEQSAKNYFPDYEEEKRYKMFDIFLETNSKKLFDIGGNVYPNLENILIKLKEKYKLAIVSNCVDGYIEAFLNSSDSKSVIIRRLAIWLFKSLILGISFSLMKLINFLLYLL